MARAKLGEILVQRGLIDAATLKRALGEQVRFAAQKFRLGQILVDMKACTWTDVAQALSHQQGVPFADLSAADPNAVKLLAADLCEKHRAVAYGREVGPPEVVKVAFADPADLAAVDAIRFRLGKPLRAAIGAPDAIQQVINQVHKGLAGPSSGAIELDAELFGDSGDVMSVEHFQSGDLQVPGLTPSNEHRPPDGGPAINLSNEASFDALFGDMPAPARSATPPPLQAEPEPDMPSTPRAAITLFPDTRQREAPPPPPPATPPTKPTLVISSNAFAPGPPEEVLLSPEAVEMVEATEPLEAAPLAKEGLFAAAFDASEHPDPMHPVHAAEPGAAAELFGSSFEAPPPTGEVQLDAALLAEETAPDLAVPVAAEEPVDAASTLEPLEDVEDVELDLAQPEPDAAAAPAAVAEEAEVTEELPVPPPAQTEAKAQAPREAEGLANFAGRPLSAEELAVIGVIEQLADGVIEDAPIKQAKPAHMIAALVRLLIRQGVIRETEFLEELTRK